MNFFESTEKYIARKIAAVEQRVKREEAQARLARAAAAMAKLNKNREKQYAY